MVRERGDPHLTGPQGWGRGGGGRDGQVQCRRGKNARSTVKARQRLAWERKEVDETEEVWTGGEVRRTGPGEATGWDGGIRG